MVRPHPGLIARWDVTRHRYTRLLSALLPAGTFGVSMALAATLSPADATSRPVADDAASAKQDVAQRLQAVRDAVTEASVLAPMTDATLPDPNVTEAQWRNWPNWNNWHNWRNGWANGWPNGWRNVAPGWHNWHNFWRNW
jgi:rSAM-associated Gly-rich repeat protein